MTRQTDRAYMRDTAKVNATEDRVAARVATRKVKKLTALSKNQAAEYPSAFTVPFLGSGKYMPHQGKQEVARRLRQAVA